MDNKPIIVYCCESKDTVCFTNSHEKKICNFESHIVKSCQVFTTSSTRQLRGCLPKQACRYSFNFYFYFHYMQNYESECKIRRYIDCRGDC